MAECFETVTHLYYLAIYNETIIYCHTNLVQSCFEMAYFRLYWSHFDISTTICPHLMAPMGLELMTLGFSGMAS